MWCAMLCDASLSQILLVLAVPDPRDVAKEALVSTKRMVKH